MTNKEKEFIFKIFQRILNNIIYNDENNIFDGRVVAIFRISFYEKYFGYLKVILRPDEFLTIEPFNKYDHSIKWPTKEDLDDRITEIEENLKRFVKNDGIINNSSINLFFSWFFVRFVRKIFDHSGSSFSNENRRALFRDFDQTFNFWEIITYYDDYEKNETVGCIPESFFYNLFIDLIIQLEKWSINLKNLNRIKLKFNEFEGRILESLFRSTLEIGYPIIISKRQVLLILKFEKNEDLNIFKENQSSWIKSLFDLLRDCGYKQYQQEYIIKDQNISFYCILLSNTNERIKR